MRGKTGLKKAGFFGGNSESNKEGNSKKFYKFFYVQEFVSIKKS